MVREYSFGARTFESGQGVKEDTKPGSENIAGVDEWKEGR